MFFTTSDLVGQMNSAMGVGRGAAASDENKNDNDEVRGFELHTRMPDGFDKCGHFFLQYVYQCHR
jgi:hypothetical protein